MSTASDSNLPPPVSSLLATIMADESFRPSEPTTLAETGLPVSLVESLIIKRLAIVGLTSGRQLANDLCLPFQLVDEAFLRRIPYKIEIGDPSHDEFHELFQIYCDRIDCECKEEVVDYLLETHFVACDRRLRRCHPRDLLRSRRYFAGQCCVSFVAFAFRCGRAGQTHSHAKRY